VQGTGGLAITGNSTITGTLTGLTGITSSGTTTLSALNTAGVVHNSAAGVLSTGVVALGTETSGNYVATLGSGTGVTIGSNTGAGSTPTISVNYGALANTAVQGNITLTCPSGSGNLTGGATVITLGSGGTCGAITTNPAVTFGTSVTTPLVTSTAGLAVTGGTTLALSSTGANGVTLDTGGAAGITIAGANATGVTIGNVTSNPAISFAGSGTFGTTTGNVSLNGNTTIATGKTLTVTNGLTSLTGGLTVSGTTTLSSLNSVGILHTNASGVVSTSAVVLGTDTSGSYVANLGAGTGVTIGSNTGAGSAPTIAVNYGSLANTAVQGNVTLTCPSGTGNLSGGGTSITLGTGGTCGGITISNSPTFTGLVTSVGLTAGTGLIQGTGGETTTGAIALNTTGTANTAIGNSTGTFSVTSNALNIGSTGAISGVTTLSLSGAITGATSTNTINGLVISSGSLSSVGSITLSGAISGGTTYSGSGNITTSAGNINATAGALQTAGTSRIDSTGNLTNIGNFTATAGSTFATTGANGFAFKPGTNNTTAFQIQKADSTPLFVVDTTSNNLVTNPGFETGTTGWATRGSSTISQNLVKANTYNGLASLQAVVTAASSGASTNSFTATIASGTQYTMSVYVRSTSAISAMRIGYTTSGGDTACAGTLVTLTTGFQRMTCTFTPASNVTAIWIDNNTTGTATTEYIDGVQLETGAVATAFQIGNIQLRGVITNPLSLQPVSNSTSSLQVLNAAGANVFTVDTINSRIGVGVATPAQAIDVTGSIQASSGYYVNNVAGSTVAVCTASQYLGAAKLTGGILTAGVCTADATGISDIRLKKDIVSLGSALDQIAGVNTYSFYYKCDDPSLLDLHLDCDKQQGVIAQELQQIFPDLVDQRSDGYYEVDYRGLSVYTLDAVSQLAKFIDSKGDAKLNDVSAKSVSAPNIVSNEVGTPYPTAEAVSAGDVVVVDADGNLHKSTTAAQKGLVGVVTGLPGLTTDTGVSGADSATVATAGRVSVKVTGPVAAGDALTSSNVLGTAMKADDNGGPIIGTATTSFDGNGEGTVLVSVGTSFMGGNFSAGITALQSRVDTLDQQVATLSQQAATAQASPTGLTDANGQPVNFNDLVVGSLTVNLDLIVKGAITVNGPATFAQAVRFQGDTVFDGDVTANQHVTFGSDAAGYATVHAGQTKVHVSFKKPYGNAPIITVSLGNGQFATYSYSSVAADGFDIVLQAPASQELQFSWTATPVTSAVTSEQAVSPLNP
jgi:hypothetical protein